MFTIPRATLNRSPISFYSLFVLIKFKLADAGDVELVITWKCRLYNFQGNAQHSTIFSVDGDGIDRPHLAIVIIIVVFVVIIIVTMRYAVHFACISAFDVLFFFLFFVFLFLRHNRKVIKERSIRHIIVPKIEQYTNCCYVVQHQFLYHHSKTLSFIHYRVTEYQ